MFSNNIMSFIMLNIYLLLIVNMIMLSVIFISISKDKLETYRYSEVYKSLKPLVLRYIKNGDNLRRVKTKSRGKYKFKILLDMMLEYAKDNNVEIIDRFERLECVDYLIKKGKRGVDLDIIKAFSIIKSPKAYEILMCWTSSEDFEEKYMSFYALSLLKLEEERIETVIDKLINSSVVRDRQIEIINNFNLSIDKYINLLEVQKTEFGKVVLLRVIKSKIEIVQEQYSERIVKYLDMEKEIKIAAVLTIASSMNEKYLPILVKTYQCEDQWEIRAAVAKALINFKSENILELLKTMIYDEAWWVRTNALETLEQLGTEGIHILVDLSLDTANEKVASLAYNILNSNKNIYETAKSY
ncbi:HEAT repeat domain-containing protein [Clostridium sp.]|uniref:HEAT repeat domain-containing protein n=1 Tax=Clostridium sp. TaxID=1506 RepID=UPI002FCA4E10